MNEAQKRIWRQIQDLKADPHRDEAALKRLARMLTRDDDRSREMEAMAKLRDSRGGSRSPSFGKWPSNDDNG